MNRNDVIRALPAGQNRDRLRLWDRYYQPLWDSATATTPAYRHVGTWVNASILHADGSYWQGQLIRTSNGIERWSRDDYLRVMHWPTRHSGDRPFHQRAAEIVGIE